MLASSLSKIIFLQAHQILERHLVVANTAYTMMDIKRMTHSGPVVLHTVRDKLELQLQEKANGVYNNNNKLIKVIQKKGKWERFYLWTDFDFG